MWSAWETRSRFCFAWGRGVVGIKQCLGGGGTHLHHEHDGVEGDHGHDGVLERRGHHELPHAVLETLLVLGHMSGQGFSADGEVNAGPLRERAQQCEGLRQERGGWTPSTPPSHSMQLFCTSAWMSASLAHPTPPISSSP